MNRTCRSVRNDKMGKFALKGLAASLMLAFASNIYALPVGGVVSAGSASIAGGAGTVTVNQSSQNAAINWQSFSIGQTEAVRFVQPNSSSVALNRVLGPDPSSIFGSLTANGKVFLVNPGGILFGPGAQVNVGGLVASTRNITDGDFIAGNYRFAGAGGGTVVNQGSINAEGGYVALLGASVNNEGLITARLGTVALAAGNAFTLDVAGDGLLNVAVNQGAFDALAANGGVIRADGGQVLLTALSAGDLLQSAVNNTGIIQAQTVENRNGTIRLLGDMQSGTVSVGGTLDASGTGAGQSGSSVTVTGHHVGLFDGHINASGDAGGGTVLIGGGYQGNNPAVPNATATYMSADSTIGADAITNGNGGTVVLWANDSTRAYGGITARGGAQGGDGGLIETSAHWLDVWGANVNAGAPNGKPGTWLLDPADITIGGGLTAGIPVAPTGGVYAPDSGATSSTLNVTNLRTALEAGGGTNVTITTTNTGVQGSPPSGRGDITIASALTWTPVATATLTLNAVGDVNINAAVTTTRGSLEVCCGRDINVNALITTTGVVATPNTGGNVLLSAGRDVNIVRAPATIQFPDKNLAGITTTSGNIEICAGRDINLGNTFDGAALITLTNSVAASLPPTGPVTPRGMTLIAGTAATGPGAAGGTLKIGVGTIITVTGPAGISPVNIFYNPTSYTAPTDYSGFFATGNGAPFTQFMLVYPGGADKAFDNTTTAVFTSFKPDINGLVPGGGGLTLSGGTADFANVGPGVDIPITYSGVTLGGATAGFALPIPCCGVITRTTGTIRAAIVPPPLPTPLPPPDALPDVPIELAALPIFQNTVGAVFPRETGLNISVLDEGIRMPPVVVAKPAPVPPPPVVVPPAPPVYVPPVLPRRPDRN